MLRSIVEEASSVAKAIEKAWHNAGKPEEFSVKVYQLPQRNLLGFTTISAKVGLFFTARYRATEEHSDRRSRQQRSGQRDQRDQRGHRASRPPREQRELRGPREPRVQRPEAMPMRNDSWSQELITAATDWLRGALGELGMADRSFEASAQGGVLRVIFANSMGRDEREERVVLNSFCHLMTEVLRNKFGQRAMRNLKISVDSATGNARSDERV